MTTNFRADYLLPDCWWRKHLESLHRLYEIREKIIEDQSWLYIVPEKTELYQDLFEENFRQVSIVYKAYRIFPENEPDEFMEDYRSFLKENQFFLLSYSAEDDSVMKSYMLNLGVKVLDKSVLGKPYIKPLCGYGQKIEEIMLKTPEAQELKRRYSVN